MLSVMQLSKSPSRFREKQLSVDYIRTVLYDTRQVSFVLRIQDRVKSGTPLHALPVTKDLYKGVPDFPRFKSIDLQEKRMMPLP